MLILWRNISSEAERAEILLLEMPHASMGV